MTLVQYSVPGKDYSVGFSTREAAEKRRGAGVSRHNFKDDMDMVMGWLETLREMDAPYDCDPEEIYVAGSLNLPQINRIRRILGMKDLPPACGKCHAATLRACICDDLNHAVRG